MVSDILIYLYEQFTKGSNSDIKKQEKKNILCAYFHDFVPLVNKCGLAKTFSFCLKGP